MKLQAPIRRAIGMIAALLMVTHLMPAYAATFGRTTIGTIPSSGLRPDFKRGSKFVLSEKAVVYNLCVFLDGNGGGTGLETFRLALYRDQNGVPTEEVLETNEEAGIESGVPGTAHWYCLFTDSVEVEAGSYWIMIHTGGDPAVARYFYDGAANWYGNADTYADGPSEYFGAGAAGNGTLSLYAEYFPASQARYAGATTVGSRVSSPMTAQQKRGSSFVLTEEARILSLNAYIDGLGGTSGSQLLAIALYDDVNGEPSSLVTWGLVSGLSRRAGRKGHWVSANPNSGGAMLKPGRYWIVLHTSGAAGVLRYYMQGTGNWRGNASPGDQPADFFGPANAGDGTITANIRYTPTDVLDHTFGRTVPGTVPSGALNANFTRGSAFEPDHYFYAGWVTALWAYMDGNGGATGSQKVRLALYKDAYAEPEMHRVVYSDEVVIPAGKPAGWVRFPVPRTQISWSQYDIFGFHLMMSSGGTQGVARYYLSNDRNNWVGGPAAYGGLPDYTLYLGDSPYPDGAGALSSGTREASMYVEYVNTADTDSVP